MSAQPVRFSHNLIVQKTTYLLPFSLSLRSFCQKLQNNKNLCSGNIQRIDFIVDYILQQHLLYHSRGLRQSWQDQEVTMR